LVTASFNSIPNPLKNGKGLFGYTRIFFFAKLICTERRTSLDDDTFEALQLLRAGFGSGMITVEDMVKRRAQHAFANDWKETTAVEP
jgi:hypothetical protein